MKKLISVVIPAYNEQSNLPLMYAELSTIFAMVSDSYNYELIFVDDGSFDATWQVLTAIAAKNGNIKLLKLSRNFGHQLALTAGYDYAHGDAIITMDADMQDSPSLILHMLGKWEGGFSIVYARRIDRKDSVLKKIAAYCYYKLLSMVANVSIPRNVGDFRLIDRKVLQQLHICREKSRYLRGLVAWTGFKHTFVDFNRSGRNAGKSGYTWKKMFKLAVDGLTAFSTVPLKIAGIIGILILASGGCMCIYELSLLMRGASIPLTTWLLILLYCFAGVQCMVFWVLGEYIARIYEQQQGRPLYVVDMVVENKPAPAHIPILTEHYVSTPPPSFK